MYNCIDVLSIFHLRIHLLFDPSSLGLPFARDQDLAAPSITISEGSLLTVYLNDAR